MDHSTIFSRALKLGLAAVGCKSRRDSGWYEVVYIYDPRSLASMPKGQEGRHYKDGQILCCMRLA